MKRKRLLVGALSVSLLATACGGSSDSNGSGGPDSGGVTKVVFWDLFGGGDGATMKEIVKEFNQTHPNIKVVELTQDWGQYYTKLMTAVFGNKAPDLAVSHADNVLMLARNGVIQPLDTQAQQAGIQWDDFVDTARNISTIDKKHYAVPLDFHSFLLYYNKKILGDLHMLDSQGKPEFKDYNDFISQLEKIKSSGYTALSFPQAGTFPLWLWYSFYEQMGGGDIYNADKTKATFDNEKGKAALKDVYDLWNTYKVIPPNVDHMDQLFESKKAAFALDGTWMVDTYHQSLGDDLGVVSFPKLFDQPAVFADSHQFVLPTKPSRDAKTTAAAMNFVKWVTDNGAKWAHAGHLPAETKVLASDELKKQPFRENYADQANFMKIFPPTEQLFFMNPSDLITVTDGIWIEQYSSLDEGLKKMEDTVNQILSK